VAAAVHIQRVARGRAARKCAASVSIARDVPVLPLPAVSTPPAESRQHQQQLVGGEQGDGDGFTVSDTGGADGDAAEHGECVGGEASAGDQRTPSPSTAEGSDDREEGDPSPNPLEAPVESGAGEQPSSPVGVPSSTELRPRGAGVSKRESASRNHAASRIQVRALLIFGARARGNVASRFAITSSFASGGC